MHNENQSLPAAVASPPPCHEAVSVRVRQLVDVWAGVARRAEIFQYPIREMQARQWIAETNDTAALESELCHFFGVPNIAAIREVQISQGAGPRAAAGKE